jgi:PDZ domain-containing protein
MSRRAVTLLVAGAGVLAAFLAAALAPVPYVALTPGPTLNTLGSLRGHPLIAIQGRKTYPASGHLNMVTVSFIGGPGTRFNIFEALQAWLSPHDAVVPEQEIFTPGKTPQQVARQDTEEMASSQQQATAAALCELRIPVKITDTVLATIKGLPAHGVLHRGDVIAAVDGKPLTCRADAGVLIKAHRPGTPVRLTIQRHGRTHEIRLITARVQGQAVVGVHILESFRFPFTVKISIGNIGGPSAGLMFALGIIDKLSRDNLTGGKFIAGTGEISADGAVSPIGGIQQKLAGARAAGATVFLTPAANCPDALRALPAGLRLVKVTSLSQAVRELQALKAGRPVPSC